MSVECDHGRSLDLVPGGNGNRFVEQSIHQNVERDSLGPGSAAQYPNQAVWELGGQLLPVCSLGRCDRVAPIRKFVHDLRLPNHTLVVHPTDQNLHPTTTPTGDLSRSPRVVAHR